MQFYRGSSSPTLSSVESEPVVLGPVGVDRSASQWSLRRRVASAGGCNSDTPPATLQRGADRSGTDTLVVGYGVVFDVGVHAALCEELERAKKAAGDAEADAEEREWGGYVLRPTGAAVGGGGGPIYAYQLEAEGLVVQVMRRHEPFGRTPNVRVQVGAMACWAGGDLVQLRDDLRRRVEALGGRIEFEVVSRWDCFLDCGGLEVGIFNDLLHGDQFVTRVRDLSEFSAYRRGRRKTGISVGKGIVFRAYDKVNELRSQPIKAEAWRQLVWGGKAPDVCTRCEFQLKREHLKSLQVQTLEDLISKAAGILEYLTSKWLRFTACQPDRRHTERAVDHEVWKRVRRSLRATWGKACAVARRLYRGAINNEHLRAMIVGCVTTIAGVKGLLIADKEELVSLVVEQLACYELSKPVWKMVQLKRRRIERRAPMDGPCYLSDCEFVGA